MVYIKYHNGEEEKIKIDQDNVHLDMWKEIYGYLRKDKKPYYTTSISLKDILVMEAINKSLKSSSRIDIEQDKG